VILYLQMPKPYLPSQPAIPITFLLSLVFATAFPQSKAPTQTIEPTYVSVAEGLASPTVQSVIQDSFGLIWIGTVNGLQKYDGYRFEKFKNSPGKATSLQHNNVWGLMEDADHNIWVGTGLGVSRYDRRKNEFKNYLFPGYFNTPLGAPYGITFRIFQDSQKNLWAVTRFLGLLKYNKKIDHWEFAQYEVPGVELPDHYEPCLSIAEDAQGGLWFGSSLYGLMRQAKGDSVFRQVKHESIAKLNGAHTITYLYFDSTQTLWMTSRTGVHKYNPETGLLKTMVAYTEGNDDGLNHWNKILPDNAGNIWIANNFRGILKFNGLSDTYTEIEISDKMKMRTHGWNITLSNFIIDQSGIFWFGSLESGLVKYDPVNKAFQHLSHNPANPNGLSSGGIFGIVASRVKPGIVYIGTRGNGVNIYDPQKQTFEKITFKVVDDMFGGSARAIAEKDDGSLWLGTWGDGLVELDMNNKEIRRFKYDSLNENSLSHNQVRVVKPDKQGRVWVGTNNGVNILNTKDYTIQRIINKHGRQYPDQLIREMDSLIGTDQKVASIEKIIDNQNITQSIEIKETGTYWVMAVSEMDPLLMADFGWIENADKDTVWKMNNYEETLHAGGAYKNRIVLGSLTLEPGTYNLRYRTDDSHAYGKWNDAPPTQTSLYGIALLKPQAGDRVQSFQTEILPEKEELYTSGSNISDIEISDKYIWVAGEGSGIDRIDLVTNQVKTYTHNPNDANSLSHNNIRDIHADSRGMIWFATNEGITKLDPATETFTRYSESDGLPTNISEAILEGDNGEMWIATQNGLSQMVINERLGKTTFINYNSTDGIGGDVFLSLTNTRATDGRFYFGGDHGLTTFTNVTSNKTPPALIISNLFVSNKSISDFKEDSPLITTLLETKSISLAFDQNNLSFEFAALHFANPKKNQYAHMLKGYDKDWIYDNRNFAAYTNLDPGKYEFKVRASNAYGIWNEEGLALEITILPPWWRTWWAYGSYAIAFVLVGFVFDRAMRRRIKLRERERSREKELKQAKEIEKAYTELKATQSQLIQSEKMASLGELTAGIAHEIQNPLNFVNNFSEVNKELIGEMNAEIEAGNFEEVKALAKDIADNEDKIVFHGKRADGIVKSMLQHSRSSNGKKESTNINVLADEYLRLAYHGLRAKDKSFNASMKTEFDESVGSINVIGQDLGRVILNLITNAFYAVTERKQQQSESYEPTVTVSTKRLGKKIEIRVSDNGNGIPQNIVDKIFQPFFTTKPTGQGTGLGLSMSYDIITNAHGGELKVETKQGAGTTFIIILTD
jgi:signal transduction histidine kinase/ligand-binding sensor domain-containing protein